MIDLDFIRLVNIHKARYPSSTTRIDSTPHHNAAIGGAVQSHHLLGRAIDLIFDPDVNLMAVADYAVQLGFGGVELDLRNNHLHLDMRSIPWHVYYTKEGRECLLTPTLV